MYFFYLIERFHIIENYSSLTLVNWEIVFIGRENIIHHSVQLATVLQDLVYPDYEDIKASCIFSSPAEALIQWHSQSMNRSSLTVVIARPTRAMRWPPRLWFVQCRRRPPQPRPPARRPPPWARRGLSPDTLGHTLHPRPRVRDLRSREESPLQLIVVFSRGRFWGRTFFLSRP